MKGPDVQVEPNSSESTVNANIEGGNGTEHNESRVRSGNELGRSSSHLVQRGIIYGLLLIFVAIALNDFRIRKGWENDCQILADSLIHSKGLPQENADAELVELMLNRNGVGPWLDKRGYTFADDRSGFKLKVYAKDSGLRQFWIVVDYHVGGTKESPVMTTINFTPEDHYFWDVAAPSEANSKVASQQTRTVGSERDNTRIQGSTPLGTGGNSGQGGRGNRSQNGSFDPEKRFAEMDVNDDGQVSKNEFMDANEKAVQQRDNRSQNGSLDPEERFAEMDASDDGQVSKEEFMDAIEKAVQQRRAGRSRGGRGSAGEGGPGVPGSGGGLYDVPDDPGEDGEEVDPNRLPSE